MFSTNSRSIAYKTSTPKPHSRGNQGSIMEQSREMENSYEVTRTTFKPGSSASHGQSSYQAMFGQRSRGGNYGKLSRYGYGMERPFTAVSVNESFAQMPGILTTRSEEKQELSVLNNRFATYIDKVRRLESQNKALNFKIVELQSTKTTESRSGDMYEDELDRLRREIERLTHDKADVEIQLHNCCDELKVLEKKLKAEMEARKEAEGSVISLRKDVDDATLSRVDLETKIENLQEELALLKATAREDIESLKSQVTVKHEEVFDAPVPTADLTDALKDIRIAYEKLSKNNVNDIERVYKNTIADLQQQVKNSNQAVSETKTVLSDTRRQLQVLTVEIDGLRSTNASLEQQIAELQDRNERESEEYRARIVQLETELQECNENMARHLSDYNRLMAIKLSLDLEIATYRKLLEGEEGRISQSTSMDQSGYTTIEKSVTVESVSVSSEKSAPKIIMREEISTKSRSSSESSSTSDEN